MLRSALATCAALLILGVSTVAAGQTEIPPPQGNGRLVVVSSGQSGPEHYKTVARAIAKMGYDVVLFDGNAMEGTHGAGLKDAIAQARQMPHALPGKVGLVGFSLGGAVTLGYGVLWPDDVAVDIVWYPATSPFHDIPGYVSRIQTPVLMFAGESDTYKDCCLIDTARSIAAAAVAAGKTFELITYPDTDHDFVEGGAHYNPKSYHDALERTAAKLKQYLGD